MELANIAVGTAPQQLNTPVPSQPTTHPTQVCQVDASPSQRHLQPISYIASKAVACIKVLSDTALIIVGLALVTMVIYQRTARLVVNVKSPSVVVNEPNEFCDQDLPILLAGYPNRKVQSGSCVLPPYPEHGIYLTSHPQPTASGDGYQSVELTVICEPNYGVMGTATALCFHGKWVHCIPKCVRFCKLDKHPSVKYYCLVNGFITGHRFCKSYEPSGTIVRPVCNGPNYYSAFTLANMRCINGSWNYVALCSPECGRVTPNGVNLVIDGRAAQRGELPWHVAVYRKITRPYMQICGGSIVTYTAVVSAAHCFCNSVGEHNPTSMYAVAAGKIYRPWNNSRDLDAQKSDVQEIKTPPRYQGSAANFQDDIAILILKTPFKYHTFVRPICLDFDTNFDSKQLQPGKLGKVAGWGLTAENGNPSQMLKVVELPYVDIKQCINAAPADFREYITSDKICAGYGNGTATVCKGDSGGGLAFLEPERGTERYYLRGIVSTAAKNDDRCNSNTLTAFTQILKHAQFIMDFL